jgi:hypothetical protein
LRLQGTACKEHTRRYAHIRSHSRPGIQIPLRPLEPIGQHGEKSLVHGGHASAK